MKLTFNSISKSYGNNKALNAFCAELEPGIHALLGPNGSGKSTLMNIITGNLKADEGSVIFSDRGNSEDIRKMGIRFSAMLGFMPQYPGLYPNFTVEQFMWYMATLKDVGAGMSGRRRREYVKDAITDILRHVELDGIARRRIGALSGGMKQRAALARALSLKPKVLLMDEPFSSLDIATKKALYPVVTAMAAQTGCTILLVTHDIREARTLGSHIAVMSRQKKGISAVFSKEAMPEAETLEKMLEENA